MSKYAPDLQINYFAKSGLSEKNDLTKFLNYQPHPWHVWRYSANMCLGNVHCVKFYKRLYVWHCHEIIHLYIRGLFLFHMILRQMMFIGSTTKQNMIDLTHWSDVQYGLVITQSSIISYCIQQIVTGSDSKFWQERHPIPRPDRRAMGCLL